MASKLLLLSIVISMLAIPILAARDASPRRGLRKAVVLFLAYSAFYVLLIRFVYPRLI